MVVDMRWHAPSNREMSPLDDHEHRVQRARQADRVLRARIAAHTRWAHTDDRTAATATARQAFLDRFEREVDPEAQLDPRERAIRAEHARKAYYLRLALKSAQKRRTRSGNA